MSPGIQLPSPNQFKDGMSRGFMKLHSELFRRTGGKIGGKFRGAEMMLLTTTGRRSGEPRTTPLMCIRDGDRFLAIGSYGGDDREPQWVKNLRANPDATVEAGGEKVAVRGTVATPEEKKALWPKAVAAYKGYDSYQRKTSRDIPVIILTPSA